MLIDVTRLVTRRLKGRLPTGVDRVALAYVERFGLWRHRPTCTPALAATNMAQALIRIGTRPWILDPTPSRLVFDWLLSHSRSRPPWRALWPTAGRSSLNAADCAGRWIVNAGHSGLEHRHWASGLRAAGARPLFVIHDLIPLTHPQFCRAGEADRHARRMRHALQWGHAIVANSNATLQTLMDWAAAQELPMPPATVAHLGSSSVDHTATVPTVPLDEPYFVCLGTLEPRKNHAMLLHVWERLVQRQGLAKAPRLVLIGQAGWEIEHLQRLLDRTPALQGCVIRLPRCTDAELASWLQHARALLFPSFVEGFGLPLVEALAAGVPVIASDLPVFREVARCTPEYVDPLDGASWLRAIDAYAQPSSALRLAQRDRLHDFVSPSWCTHFEAVDSLMAAVDGNTTTDAARGRYPAHEVSARTAPTRRSSEAAWPGLETAP